MESACVSCTGTTRPIVSFGAIAVWIFLVDLQLAAAMIKTNRDILNKYFIYGILIIESIHLFTSMPKTALVALCNANSRYGLPSCLLYPANHHLGYALTGLYR